MADRWGRIAGATIHFDGGGDNGDRRRSRGASVLGAESAEGERGRSECKLRREINQIGEEEGLAPAGPGAGHVAGVAHDAYGDAEVHLRRDSREMADRRLGLRHQLSHAEAGEFPLFVWLASIASLWFSFLSKFVSFFSIPYILSQIVKIDVVWLNLSLFRFLLMVEILRNFSAFCIKLFDYDVEWMRIIWCIFPG